MWTTTCHAHQFLIFNPTTVLSIVVGVARELLVLCDPLPKGGQILKQFEIDQSTHHSTKNMEKLTTERQLPEELLMLILARLPWQDTLRLRRVCKQWSGILRSPQFLTLCSNSPSRGVPLFLSSAFSEIDSTLYHHPRVHKCLLQGGICHDCEFQLLSPAEHKWSIFPRTWFNSFLQEGLLRTRTRCLRLVAVKGGIFLIFFRRQHKSTTTNTPRGPLISAAVTTISDNTYFSTKLLQTEDEALISCSQNNSEIVYLVNPFTQTCRLLSLPAHLESKGTSFYWMKIKKLVVDKQSNTLKVLLGPTVRKCDKHERCDIWRLDCYDVNRNVWCKSFSFHLGRTVTIRGGDIQQSVGAGWLYDATIVGEKLFFITCHSDSLFGVWQFESDSDSGSGSIFPTRLADIPVLNLYKPSLHESEGRLMILGQSFNMDDLDFSFSIWEYDAWNSRWIQLVSIFSSQPRVACWILKGEFGQDLACISVESAGKSEYFVCDLKQRTRQKLQGIANGRKLFMIEPRLDMQL
ncbi:hypothetical protein R1sor_025976 [Riccia sorocarpa]|uniref:F-box domain-containing protein n=1 Tax=Riccia sorocarpa TaxID=122646 RepID=A0ABD3GAP0_9MARC